MESRLSGTSSSSSALKPNSFSMNTTSSIIPVESISRFFRKEAESSKPSTKKVSSTQPRSRGATSDMGTSGVESLTHHSRGVADGQHARGHVGVHHAAGGDDRAVPHSHPGVD